jgi:carboxylesterase type B
LGRIVIAQKHYSIFTASCQFFYNLTHYLAVIHGAELTYLFMIWDQHNINETDIQLANFFGESWTNFAKNGYFLLKKSRVTT